MLPDLLAPGRAAPYLLAAFAIGYLIGATPVGLIIARRLGLGDIRRIGSGNIGVTNVLRTGHRGAAAITLALDVLKGFVPAALALAWFGPLVGAAAGLGAFVGHCFSFYLSFWGGKGVATGFGVLLALRWEVALICAGLWALTVALTRYASAGSLAAATGAVVLFPVFEAWDVWPAVFAMWIIVLWRHRGNVGRLLRGDEPRLSFARK